MDFLIKSASVGPGKIKKEVFNFVVRRKFHQGERQAARVNVDGWWIKIH